MPARNNRLSHQPTIQAIRALHLLVGQFTRHDLNFLLQNPNINTAWQFYWKEQFHAINVASFWEVWDTIFTFETQDFILQYALSIHGQDADNEISTSEEWRQKIQASLNQMSGGLIKLPAHHFQ